MNQGTKLGIKQEIKEIRRDFEDLKHRMGKDVHSHPEIQKLEKRMLKLEKLVLTKLH